MKFRIAGVGGGTKLPLAMPFPIARGLRLVGPALALLLAAEGLAASKRSALMGQTRDQILDLLGDPRSAIVTGNREVLLFSRERVILRDGVVIDVQILPAEAPPRAPVVVPPPPPVVPAASPAPAAPAAVPAPVSAPAPGPVAPIVPIQGYTMPVPVPAPAPAALPSAPAAPVAAPVPAQPSPAPVEPPPPPEPKLEIRAVRKPGSGLPGGVAAAVAVAPAVEPSAAIAPAPSAAPLPSIAVAPARSVASAPPVKPAMIPPPPPPPVRGTEVAAASGVSVPLLAGLGGVLVALAVFLFRWGGSRRAPSLTSAALSRHAALGTHEVKVGGVQFTAALLRGLEFRRFRDLVAAYYGKTGAVATAVDAGPDDVVHVQISWKGEARPFACVRCLSPVSGPIPAAPLEQLAAVLAVEEIRRGYVVTSGSFSSAARDFAEEKSLTILSGELLAEKLNALPDAARSELMDQVLAVDAG